MIESKLIEIAELGSRLKELEQIKNRIERSQTLSLYEDESRYNLNARLISREFELIRGSMLAGIGIEIDRIKSLIINEVLSERINELKAELK